MTAVWEGWRAVWGMEGLNKKEKKNEKKLIDTDNRMVIARGRERTPPKDVTHLKVLAGLLFKKSTPQRWEPSLDKCHVERGKKASTDTFLFLKWLVSNSSRPCWCAGPSGTMCICATGCCKAVTWRGMQGRGLLLPVVQGRQTLTLLTRVLDNSPLWLVSP